MYEKKVLDYSNIYHMIQNPVTTNLGKYKVLFSSFRPIVTKVEGDITPMQNTNDTELRTLAGIQYKMDIGISASPDLVDDYGR